MFGSASLVTTRNHLSGFDSDDDSFVLQSDGSISLCKVVFDSTGAVFDVTRNELGSAEDIIQTWVHKQNSSGRKVIKRPMIKFSTKDEVFSIGSDNSMVKNKHLNSKKVVLLGMHVFNSVMVLLSVGEYQIINLESNESYFGTTSISKCISVIAASKSCVPVLSEVDVVYCDGLKLYHCVNDTERDIDAGKCLSLCKTQNGFLGSFETNWNMSPMQFFKDDAINLESLQIPINHTSSNEARLQFYSADMTCIDDHPLPAHSEPALLTVHPDIDLIAVSGFYTPLVSLFRISKSAIVHVKDISVGSAMRSVGLVFHGNSLLALKRKFDVDQVSLAFPSKSKLVSGDLSLDVLDVKCHIKPSSKLPEKMPRFAREAIFDEFKSRIYNIQASGVSPEGPRDTDCIVQTSGKEILEQTNNFIKSEKRNKSKNAIQFDIHFTDEEITRKSKEIMEDYKNYEPSSDAELSDDTIQLLTDCRRDEAFRPFPVPSGSDSDDEITRLGQSEMINPDRLILPDLSMVGGLTQQVNQLVVSISSGTESREDEICLSSPLESEEVCYRSKKTVKRYRKLSTSEGVQGPKSEQKLDRIIDLLEKQNLLLEKIFASQIQTL